MSQTERGLGNQSPLERLRSLGITEPGNGLERQFQISWNERARLANKRRPLAERLMRKGRISAADIAEEETLAITERAGELANMVTLDPANRTFSPILVAEFHPKTVKELRAGDVAERAVENVRKALDKRDWRKAVKAIRKAQRRLADQHEATQSLLDESLGAVKSEIAETVAENNGAQTLKALVAFHNVFEAPRRIVLQGLPGITEEMLQNSSFINSLGNQIKRSIELDALGVHSVERSALVRAGFSDAKINALPGLRNLVERKLIRDLEVSGPTYFGYKANSYRGVNLGIYVDSATVSQQAARIVARDLARDLGVSGPIYFAHRAGQYEDAGLGSHVDAVRSSDQIASIVAKDLTRDLSVSGPIYFAHKAGQYRDALLGDHVDSTIASPQVRAIVTRDLIRDLTVSGPTYFAYKVGEYERAQLGAYVKVVKESPETARIVLRDLQQALRVSGQAFFDTKIADYRNAGLDADRIWNARVV